MIGSNTVGQDWRPDSHLHGGVVDGDEGGEQIQVASGEHNGKQDLALSRNTFDTHAKESYQLLV